MFEFFTSTKDALIFSTQKITPEIAKTLLKNNSANRRIKQPIVLQYARDMANGIWKTNTGEAIKISKSGVLLDGQHRLLAIIKANTTITLNVITNVDDEVFDVLDTGSIRNGSDVFKIDGIKHENSLPSIIALYNLLKDGNTHNKIQKNKKAPNAVILKQYHQNETYWQCVAKVATNCYHAFAKVLQPSHIGGFYAFFYELNPNKADEFIDQLTTGRNISNDVITLLRNKLMQDKVSPRKMKVGTKFALIIKSWNVFLKNDSIKLLKFDEIRETFPSALSY